MKAAYPLGIDLHKVGLGQVAEFLVQQAHRSLGMIRARTNDERMRQRIDREMVQRFTESRLLPEFFECLVGSNQCHLLDVGALPDDVRQPARVLD